MIRRLIFWVIPAISAVAFAQDPAILQVHVVEGEGAVYPAGSRATKGVTLQVTDETGKPVEGATLSFILPETGPTGKFSSGGRTEIATTKADGRASVWGMQWDRTPGAFEIRITAAKGKVRAGIVCSQYLTSRQEAARARGGGHKWLWIAIAVAGAGGAAAAGIARKPGASTSAGGVQIGAPSINLGRPQ
ncbi:MAG: hypothetical protein ACRD30_06810 [Bryobacteraceae bacterium]